MTIPFVVDAIAEILKLRLKSAGLGREADWSGWRGNSVKSHPHMVRSHANRCVEVSLSYMDF